MKRKFLGFLIFCAVAGALFLFDFGRSKLFSIELVEVNPSPIPADGTSTVVLKVRLTRNGRPVEGHDLYALSLDGGNFAAYRINTDDSGEAVFTYHPYRVSSTFPVKDIRFNIRDESNSVFFEINAENTFTVPAVEVKTYTESKIKMSDIFGE
jgi:hypothetical protein